MNPAAAFLFAFTVAIAASVAAEPRNASCVRIELLDQDNLPVAGQEEVVGLLVGGKPILPEASYPRYAAVRTGTAAPCPAALVESVAENYKDSCLTVERRAATVNENNASPESVASQCQKIRESLGDSLTPYLK